MLTKGQQALLAHLLRLKGQKRVDWRWSLSGKSRSCFIERRFKDAGVPRMNTTTIFSSSKEEIFFKKFEYVKAKCTNYKPS